MLGPSAEPGVFWIKDREVLAQDLARGIALDTLCAHIPGSDLAIDIEHENRVVGNPFDEQAEPLLALAQRLFMAAPLGQIARDLRKAHERRHLDRAWP